MKTEQIKTVLPKYLSELEVEDILKQCFDNKLNTMCIQAGIDHLIKTGGHDNGDTTFHDFTQGYIAAKQEFKKITASMLNLHDKKLEQLVKEYMENEKKLNGG